MVRHIMWWLRKVQARGRGRSDGREGIPTMEEETIFASGEFALKQAADATLRWIAKRWAKSDEKFKERYCGVLAELRAAEKTRDGYKKEVDRLDTKHEKNLGEIATEKQTKLRSLEQQWRISPTAHWLVITALFVGELPLNAIAFRVFPESEIVNYVMTLGLAVALVGGAELLGVLLRNEERSSVENILTAAAIVIPLGAIFAIALVRKGFLEAQFAELVEQAIQAKLPPPREKISPAMATVVFVLINLLIYSIAAIVSYFSHDPIAKLIRSTERPLSRAKALLAAAEHRIEQLGVQLARIAAVRQKVFDAAFEHAQIERNGYQELIQEYRAGNMRARGDKTLPPTFKTQPNITWPKKMNELDWNCDVPAYAPALASTSNPSSGVH